MSSKNASAALFAWKFVEFYRWLVGTDSGRSLFIFALQLGIARAPPTPQWLMTCAIIDLHWLTTNYNWHRGPNWQDLWPFQFEYRLWCQKQLSGKDTLKWSAVRWQQQQIFHQHNSTLEDGSNICLTFQTSNYSKSVQSCLLCIYILNSRKLALLVLFYNWSLVGVF